MLTGDKVETACCVAMSCGLVSKGQKLFKITGETDLIRIDQLLDKFEKQRNAVMVMDGLTLQLIIS